MSAQINVRDDFWVIETLESVRGKGNELRAELLKIVPSSRTERGCISYELFVNKANPELFTVVMGWTSQADYNAHNESLHITEFVNKFQNKLYTNDRITELLCDKLA